ncbi:MAG: DUF4013 domain-containing protein [Anaerolineales bacterium]|nr:MAG: DUF4013 domain-containing protein [Anaerolineales bacterium]
MDVSRALAFVFDDEEWLGKVLLTAVISLVPVFGPFALGGYVIAVVRNVMASSSRPLPHWEEPGRYFADGLKFCAATLVYALPLLILICPVAMSWLLPLIGGDDSEATTALLGVSGAITVLLGCLGASYGLFYALLTPVLQIRYAETGEIRACLRPGTAIRFLLDNFGRILMVLLVQTLVGLLVTVVFGGVFGVLAFIPLCGQVLAGVGALLLLPVGVWLVVVSGHLYGQIGREAGVTALSG